MLSLSRLAVLATGVAVVACGKGSETTVDTSAAGAKATSMGGMHADTLAPQVEAHVQRLATATGDSLKALVPVDRQVVTTLIADCEALMRRMKMEPPAKWRNAAADLRQDLNRMPGMSANQLSAFVPEHRKRIEGMLEMRRDMMKM